MPAAAQMSVIPGQLHSLFWRRCHAHVPIFAEMQKQTDRFGEQWTYIILGAAENGTDGNEYLLAAFTVVLLPEFLGSASHMGWSWCSSYCLFISEEQEVAPFTNSPSSFWGTGHPFNESFHDRAYTSYIRQNKRAMRTKIGGKDKVTVKLL